MNKATTAQMPKKSRAVRRLVEAGSYANCTHCNEKVIFRAKMRHQQIICNVYIGETWNRVEHYHPDCYKLSGQPYGKPIQ